MRVLHEDSRLLAVDKPPGLPVVPGRAGGDSVRSLLERDRDESLFVVHRLDAGTSGVLLLARDAAAHRALSMAFEGREVKKRYLALVRSQPPWDSLDVDAPLHEARRGKARPALPDEPGARDAFTTFTVLGRFDGFALVEARPRTGRHHQVRVHLRFAGFPLAFDPLYAPGQAALGLERTPLHAAGLEVPHPDGGRLSLEAPLPADLLAAIDAAGGPAPDPDRPDRWR